MLSTCSQCFRMFGEFQFEATFIQRCPLEARTELQVPGTAYMQRVKRSMRGGCYGRGIKCKKANEASAARELGETLLCFSISIHILSIYKLNI